MRVHVETNGLTEVVFIDGRHTAATQWRTIEETVAKLTSHRSTPAEVLGAWLMTDNPNHRPYYLPGQKIR